MSNPVEKSITTSQGDIKYWDTDNGKTPIIFVHDLLMCKEVFSKQVSALDDYRVVAIDLPGHGNSDNATDVSTYSITGYATLLNEVLDLLNITECIYVGWAVGSYILMELYHIRPGCQAFILVSHHILITNGSGMSFNDEIQIDEETTVPLYPSVDYKDVLAKDGDLDDEECDKFCTDCGVADLDGLKDIIKQSDNKVREQLKSQLWNHSGREWNTKVIPYLVILGKNDSCCNNSLISDSNHNFTIINDACRAPFWEKPDIFNALMIKFLDNL